MEAAIESAAQQTAQDLHKLLDEAKPSHPPADPLANPLGKENMATPAAGMQKKSNRGPLSAAQSSMPAGYLCMPLFIMPCHCLHQWRTHEQKRRPS